jgi:L-rhamnose-H+ transport protein
MKRMKAWKWENAWLLFSVVGLVIIPWGVAGATVPSLGRIFFETSWLTLGKVIVFGIGWGVGNILFGIGVSRLGMAVGYGIILGLIAPIGTFLPLIVLHPERLWTRQGYALMVGTVLVIFGILGLAVAGQRREKEGKVRASMVQPGFFVGLVICILAGIFSPMLNFGFVFGQALQVHALSFGAKPSMAANAIWALMLTAGFFVNAGYSVYLLARNHTWGAFVDRAGGGSHWLGGCLMGGILFGSFMAYGMGATALGPLGGIVGWPLFMSMSLITSNACGAFTGEWKGASRGSYGFSLAGIAFLIVAIVVISRGGSA